MWGLDASRNAFSNFRSDPSSALNSPAAMIGLGLLASNGRASGAFNGLQAAQQYQQNQQRLDQQGQAQDQAQAHREAQAEALAEHRAAQAEALAEHRVAQQRQQEVANDLARQRIAAEAQRSSRGTAEMRNHEFFQSLSPEQQDIWRQNNARQQNAPAANQVFDKIQALRDAGDEQGAAQLAALHRASVRFDGPGGAQGFFNAATGDTTEVVSTDAAIAGDARAAEEKARSGAIGKAQGAKQATLPGDLASANESLKVIDDLLGHEGRTSATGIGSLIPTFPGTPKADAEALMEQVSGKTFLQARDALKGTGTLTDFESAKGEAAYARLQAAQSDEAYEKGLQDLRAWIVRNMEVAKRKAGVSGGQPQINGGSDGPILWDDLP